MAHYSQDPELLDLLEQDSIDAGKPGPVYTWSVEATITFGPRLPGCGCTYGHKVVWRTRGAEYLREEFTFQGKRVSRQVLNRDQFNLTWARDVAEGYDFGNWKN